MKFIRSGKAKDIFMDEDGNMLFFFTNRVTAFDGKKAAFFEGKGEVCCKLSCFWFEKLGKEGIKTHFKEFISPNILVAKPVNILPVEVLCRNFLYGSLWKRYKRGEVEISDFLTDEAKKEKRNGKEKKEGILLKESYVEFTTKFESIDRPIEEEEIIEKGWMSGKELEHIKEETRRINKLMLEYLRKRKIILADLKLEYGKTKEGDIILADEIGTPDVCRFWDMEVYENENGKIRSLDKDVFRKEKGNLLDVYHEVYKRIFKNQKSL